MNDKNGWEVWILRIFLSIKDVENYESSVLEKQKFGLETLYITNCCQQPSGLRGEKLHENFDRN